MLNYTLESQEENHKINKIELEDGLKKGFKICRVSDPEHMDDSAIKLRYPLLNPGENKTFTWFLRVSKDAPLGYINVASNYSLRIKFNEQWTAPAPAKSTNVYVRNNIPTINNSKVIILSTCIPANGILYLVEKDKTIRANFSVDATDVEDEALNFAWACNGKYIFTSMKNEEYYYVNNLTEGHKLYFEVVAKDSNENLSKPDSPFLVYGSKRYNDIIIPNIQYYDSMAIILIIFLLMFLFITGIFKPKLIDCIYKLSYKNRSYAFLIDIFGKPITKRARFGIYLTTLTILYIILFKVGCSDNSIFIDSLGYPIFFNSLQFFEIFIFIIVFLSISYFNSCCYPSSSEIPTRLWWFNSITMATFVFSLAIIIPRITDPMTHLHYYYSSMAQAFATITAIIISFYALAISRNNEESNSRVEDHVLYLIYLNVLIVALSFWGLSTFVVIDFYPIIDLKYPNIFNLISISVFEATLLLIAPAISSLYAFMFANKLNG